MESQRCPLTFSLEDRDRLGQLVERRYNQSEIAKLHGRSQATISREVSGSFYTLIRSAIDHFFRGKCGRFKGVNGNCLLRYGALC